MDSLGTDVVVQATQELPAKERRRIIEELIWRKFENERLALRDPVWERKHRYLTEILKRRDSQLWSAYELIARNRAHSNAGSMGSVQEILLSKDWLDNEVFHGEGSLGSSTEFSSYDLERLSRKFSRSDPGNLSRSFDKQDGEHLHLVDFDIFQKIEQGSIVAPYQQSRKEALRDGSATETNRSEQIKQRAGIVNGNLENTLAMSLPKYLLTQDPKHYKGQSSTPSSREQSPRSGDGALSNGKSKSGKSLTENTSQSRIGAHNEKLRGPEAMNGLDLSAEGEGQNEVEEADVGSDPRREPTWEEWSAKYPVYGNLQLGGSLLTLGGSLSGKIDRDVDELSDLSENPEDSDLSDLDEDEQRVRSEMKHVLRHSVSCDTSVQTEDPGAVSPSVENISGAPATKDVLALALGTEPEPVATTTPVAPPRDSLDMTAKLLELTPISTQGQETDPKFELRPSDVKVPEGELAKFMCKVSGTEPLDVYWYKTGTDELIALNEDERCDTHRDGDTFTMDMYNPLKCDQGPILCIGVNNEGRCTQGIRFIVNDNDSQKKVPEFIKPLQNIEVKVGSRVKLRTKVGGYPVPRVIWYKDGKRLTNSEHIKIEKYGNRDHVLCIDYVTLDQDAEYSVVAKNLSGEAQSSAQVVVEDSSEEEDHYVRRSAPPSVAIEDYNGLYPDTEDLLKLAEQVSETRGQVTNTANKMLRSAGQMSTLHHQLDAMDQKLDHLEENAKATDQVAMETEAYKEIYRDQILREHDELQTSASAVRHITTTALDILTSADDLVQANTTGDSQGIKRKSELISPVSSNENEIEEVELKVSYIDFDRLFNAGIINRDQLHSGKVPKSVYNQVQEFLSEEPSSERFEDDSHELTMDDMPTSIDCGLKRVDSKRYKRDYVINRDSPQVRRKKWNVPLSPQSSVDLVKSTPAGLREDPHEKISEAQEQVHIQSETEASPSLAESRAGNMSPIAEVERVEDEIYLAAGRVSHLQDKITQLEDKVNEADDDETTMAALEEEVARTAAQVKGNQKQVVEVKMEVQAINASPSDTNKGEPPESQWQHALSPTRKRQSAQFVSESHPKTSPLEDNRRRSYGDKPASSEIQIQLKSPVVETKTSPKEFAPKLPSTPPPPRLPSTPPPQKVTTTPPVQKPPPLLLHGLSTEESLPESRTEFDDQVGLPSVRNLMSKFSQSTSALPEKKPGSNVKRVYSLTGRDLPRNVREKLKAQSPATAQNTNIRRSEDFSPESPRRQPLDAVFERPPSPTAPRSSTPIERSASFGSSSDDGSSRKVTRSSMSLNLTGPEVISSQQRSTVEVNLGSGATTKPTPVQKQTVVSHQSRSTTRQPVRVGATSPAPHSPGVRSGPTTPRLGSTPTEPRTGGTPTGTRSGNPLVRTSSTSSNPRTPTTPTSPLKAPARQKNSTIMARAAFWDTRITEGKASDKDGKVNAFPEMPVENFKR